MMEFDFQAPICSETELAKKSEFVFKNAANFVANLQFANVDQYSICSHYNCKLQKHIYRTLD